MSNPWAPEGWDDEPGDENARPASAATLPTVPVEPLPNRDAGAVPATPSTVDSHPEFFQPRAERPALDVDPEFTQVVQVSVPDSSPASAADGSEATVISVLVLHPSQSPEPVELAGREFELRPAPSMPSFDELVAEGFRRASVKPTIAPVIPATREPDSRFVPDVDSAPSGGHSDSANNSLSGNISGSGNQSNAIIVERMSLAPETGWTLSGAEIEPRSLRDVTYVIGRAPSSPTNDEKDILITLDHPSGTVSRTHARLDFINGVWHITDLNSTNGVSLVAATGIEKPIAVGVATPVTSHVFVGDAELEFLEVPRV